MTSSDHDLPPGHRVAGYRIEAALATSPMGAVYTANHVILPRRVALSVLHARLLGGSAAKLSVIREAQMLETLAGPRVAAVYDAGILADGRPWTAMELITGETLAAVLRKRRALPALEAATILLAVAEALVTAGYHHIVHCDLKPESIIVQGNTVTVVDWGGSASSANASALARRDPAPGLAHNLAPEQIDGGGCAGETNVFQLGVVGYELIVGSLPFRGRTPIETAAHNAGSIPRRIGNRATQVPAALDELLLGMRTRRPDERPSVAAVRDRLSAIIDAMTAASKRPVSIEISAVDVEIEDLTDAAIELERDDAAPFAARTAAAAHAASHPQRLSIM